MNRIKETKVYNISDFLNWYRQGELDIKPRYQRNPVWNMKAKSYLIDTIIRGLPIPQIFIRQIIDSQTLKSVREVIDGQQRLRTILGYINNDFSILKIHNTEYGTLFFRDLDETAKEAFLYYQIPTEVIITKDDSIIYDMFARLNTNGISLNKQELRNALFRGDFKVFCYRIASEWREFFIDLNTFKETQFSRMADVEFLSSLIILSESGIIAESPKAIDDYYRKFDDSFDSADEIEKNFKTTMRFLKEIYNNDLFNPSIFHTKNYIYTMYGSIYNTFFGIKNCEIVKLDININTYNSHDINVFANRLMNIDSYIMLCSYKDFDQIPEKCKEEIIQFFQYHVTHTTSLSERQKRVKLLIKMLNSDLYE